MKENLPRISSILHPFMELFSYVLLLNYPLSPKWDPSCNIWGFHGSNYEEWCLLGCYVLWLFTDSCHPDKGGAKFLRKVGSYKIHTAEHPRRHHSSWDPSVENAKDYNKSRDIIPIVVVLTSFSSFLSKFYVHQTPSANSRRFSLLLPAYEP
jgi:hypothetical protein